MKRLTPLAVSVGVALILAATPLQAQQVNHPTTFTGQTDLTLLNNATVTAGGALQLTPAVNNNLGGAWTTAKVPINQFTTQFDFHILGAADGMGFCIQNVSNTTIGGGGGGMGFAGMATPSMFIKFDCYNNVSTTQIYTNGAAPNDAGSIDLRALGIDWHTNNNFRCTMSYNGTAISMTLQDLTTMATNTQTFTIDLVTLMGAGTAFVGFVGATGGANANQEVLNWTYSSLPSPTGLTVTAGLNQNSLSWNPVAGATAYNIYRAPTAAGPFAAPPLATVTAPTTTYVDNTVTYPNTYFYVVQAVQGAVTSLNSNPPMQGTPLQPPISVSANSLATNENGATATFDIQINQALTAGNSITFTITSNNGGEGQVSSSGFPAAPAVSANSITFTVNGPQGPGTLIPVVVHGIDDPIVDPPAGPNYTVTVSFTSTQPSPFSGFTIPPIQCTNNDNDVPGVTVSPTAGLMTSENLTTAGFSVQLNTQPTGNVTISLTSSSAAEGTVSPATLTFTNVGGQAYSAITGSGGWNVPHVVTVTGVDDTLLDFNVPYAIVTGNAASADPGYNGMVVPDVACVNLDNEVPPALDHVWGSSGCGLLGLEALIPLLGLALLRSRRKA